jgi:hypothetical protein
MLPHAIITDGEEEPMRLPFLSRALRSSAALMLLAGCADDVPQSPSLDGGAPGMTPSFAIGLYGLSGAPPSVSGRPCSRPEYRQFDFWLGTWEIENPDGTPAGTNIIQSALDGCAVLESYAFQGYIGRSLNSYDAATDQWHQHWSDHTSAVIDIYGGSPQPGTMIMQGSRATFTDRIAWTALGPDGLRQLWEISTDGGQTFPTVQFDGFYHRRESVTRDPEVPTGNCMDVNFPVLFDFDFTLGSWNVDVVGPHPSQSAVEHAAGGRPKLRSVIAKDVGDCLIEERLSGRAGYEALVFTSVRRRLGEWVKTFVDNRGTNVFLKGGVVDGRPVLNGTVPTAGGSRDVRVTWVQDGADRFEQRWETTTDGGATWDRLLIARYTR